MLRVELQMLFRFILDPVATAKNSITGTNVYFNSHEWWERHHLKYRQIEKKDKTTVSGDIEQGQRVGVTQKTVWICCVGQ